MNSSAFLLLTDKQKFETLLARIELLEKQLEVARGRVTDLERLTTTSDLSAQIHGHLNEMEGRLREKIDTVETMLNNHILNS